MKIRIGTQVERIASDYTNGRKGEIIEINGERARVKWESSPRTWVNFKSLKALDLSPIIKSEWIQTPNMKSCTAIRHCENKRTGDEWSEYQGKRKCTKAGWILI